MGIFYIFDHCFTIHKMNPLIIMLTKIRKERKQMAKKMIENPLLLLDNSNMNTLFNEGEYKCTNMTFEEAREIIGMYNKEDIILCFSHPDTYDIIFNYIGIPKKDYEHRIKMELDLRFMLLLPKLSPSFM